MWIESLGLRNSDKDIISSKTAWLFDDHLDAAFNMLYEDILQYRGYQVHVARPESVGSKFKDNKNRSKMITKPCLQFHNIKLGGNDNSTHWILLHCYPPFDKTVDCHVYDTLGYNELDFNTLSHIGITKNLRISNRPCFQQLDGSSCGPLVVAMATDLAFALNPENASYKIDVLRQHMVDCFSKKKMTPFLRLK